MTRLGDLFDAMAERFTSIDYIGRGAVVAEMFIYGRATMIGDARYIVDAGDATACEVAVDVAEDLQGMWLAPPSSSRGWQIMPSGIGCIGGDAMTTNTAITSLAKRTGFAVARKPEDGRPCSRTCWVCAAT